MAILNKTGITDGGTIQAEHVTRTIDALTGVSTDTIIATGSFSGSFVGTMPDVVTLTFFHSPQTGTTNNTTTFFGAANSAAITSLGRFGVASPFPGTIISASFSTYASTTGTTGKSTYSLCWFNGTSYTSQSIGQSTLSTFMSSGSAAITGSNTVANGALLAIKSVDTATDGVPVFTTSVTVLIKKL